jgi:hypothetical protein
MYKVTVFDIQYTEIAKWLHVNAIDQYNWVRDRSYLFIMVYNLEFKNEADAIAFKLRFGI